jgi:TRAP-type C4-dicarboxylate transport system permease small subunit
MLQTGNDESGALERWVSRIEALILGVLLATMLGLASTQIVLRNLFDAGISWADPLIRAMVLWIGLLGAVAAARRNKHIRIDILGRYLGARIGGMALVVGDAFTAAVAAVIAWHGGRMVGMEIEFETIAFSGIPAWTLQLVIPGAFGLISVLYLVATFRELLAVIRGGRD